MQNTDNKIYWKQPISTECLEMNIITRLVYIEILMHTRNTDMKFPDYWGNGNQRTKYQLKRGQSIFSSAYFSKNTKIPINWVRASLNELTSQLTIQLTRKPFGYIVTILNYDEVMSFATHSTTPFATHPQVTNDSLATHPATQSQLTSSTNNKSVKTGKIVKTVKQEQTPESIRTEKQELPITNSNSPTNRFAHLTGTLLEDEDYNWIVESVAKDSDLIGAKEIYTTNLNELLEDEEFVDIWKDFIVYRKKEAKVKLTRRAEKQLIGQLLNDFYSSFKIKPVVEWIMMRGWKSYAKNWLEGSGYVEPKRPQVVFTKEDLTLTEEEKEKLNKITNKNV